MARSSASIRFSLADTRGRVPGRAPGPDRGACAGPDGAGRGGDAVLRWIRTPMGLPGRAEPPKPVNLPATTELTPGTSCCKPSSPRRAVLRWPARNASSRTCAPGWPGPSQGLPRWLSWPGGRTLRDDCVEQPPGCAVLGRRTRASLGPAQPAGSSPIDEQPFPAVSAKLGVRSRPGCPAPGVSA